MMWSTIFAIQKNLFVKWVTQNILFYGIFGGGWKIATYRHCTSWMMYRYTIKQFIHFALYQVVFIYFKSAMCFVTIPLVDTATLFCLEITAAKDTKELFIISIIFKIIFDNCFKIWTIGRGLVLFWPTAIIAFSRFSSEILNVIPNALLRTIQSQSGFNNANILQIMFANITPIGRPKKSKKTCNTNSFSKSYKCW